MAEDPPPVATRPALPVLDDVARSTDPAICPFLRREAGGTLLRPWSSPADDHTCVAIGAPRPQSHRQQELVCLRTAHADCPRYQRGAMATVPAVPRRTVPAIPRATLAALLILVLSAGISLGFVVQRGGIGMPVAGSESPAPTSVAMAASPNPEATRALGAPAVGASPAVEPPPVEPIPAPTAVPAPPATPIAKPDRTPKPTPKPTRKPGATPRSDRYAILTRCPDRKGCWTYTVRAGDNLFSIANYFGHSLAVIYNWNPQYPETRLRAGAKIRMPAPAR